MKSFGSDNHSGIHPLILAEIAAANIEHEPAYGEDRYTAEFQREMQSIFGAQSRSYFAFNGTGANILSMKPLLRSHNSVVCAATAHINVDECAAPETNLGCKLVTVETPDGKLTPELIACRLTGFGFQHHAQPRVISISQPTELGTLYTVDEIRALADVAHAHGMYLHMDGARFASAVAAMGITPCQMTVEAGVDVLSFGGTKNGMMVGEAVVFMNGELAPDFLYQRKNAMQLGSKQRFIAAQFLAYLRDGLWLKLAAHSNQMAKLLAERIADIPGIRLVQRVETNALFASLPQQTIDELQQSYYFYVWNEANLEVRWMCSFDTTVEDIETFADSIRQAMKNNR